MNPTESLDDNAEEQIVNPGFPRPKIVKLTVKLYADDQLVLETDDQPTWCAAMNRIMNLREPRG